MKLEGKLKKVFETETVSDKFQKRDFVVTTQEQYPQDILVQLVQDKVGLLDAFKEGEVVSVSINLRGREWVNPEGQAKYFNTIQAWKIEKIEGETVAVTGAEEDSDLPF